MSGSVANADLILASQSPRRRYLLQKAGLSFRVIPSRIDEAAVAPGPPGEFVRRLAEAKARDVARQFPASWVIGADTIVAVESKLLGKPASPDQARTMLQALSGKTHQVYTGYCILRHADQRVFTDSVCTDVTFKALSTAEIAWYIASGEPFDKAGAYAIQGLGTFLVRRINGSYTNVVGLPVCEIVEILIREGIMGLEV